MPSTDKIVLAKTALDMFPDFSASRSLMVLMSLAQLVVIIEFLFTAGLVMDWGYLGLATFYVQWQALMSAVLLTKLARWLQNATPEVAVILVYFALLFLAFLLSVLVQHLRPLVEFQQDFHLDWSFVIKNTLLSAIFIGVGLHYLYLQRRSILQHKADAYAQLSTLQAKIKPHFLFNCLNSIAQLIHKHPEKAEDMVVDLSELLRASLQDNVVETSIDKEWQLCEHYLHIEANRLQKRLQWHYDFSALDTGLSILGLSLQPLIENAIYHGIQPNPDGGKVTIIGKNHGQRVTLIVKNTVNREGPPPASTGQQMALSNIRQRLLTCYGSDAELKQAQIGHEYCVTLSYNLSARTIG